ncbi:MAG TPA: SdrD B-like domain-containing protein [Actinomycetota bacterium]|nr:SdrD B-like domain-containing protein [Actinomycetota bacterium]
MRRSAVRLMAALIALATIQLMAPGATLAAPGDVDLEVTVTGQFNAGLLGLGPSIDWTVTVTNSTADEAVTTTATGVVVRDVLTSSPSPSSSRSGANVSRGSYNGSGTWTVGSLAPGSAATLTFSTQYGLLSGSINATLSAEVTALSQPDRDSQPAEDSDVGDQDDEAVFRTGSSTNRSIGDLVWNDLDGGGRFTTDEPRLRGVQVIVSSGSSRLFAGRTNASGIWDYAGVPNGSTVTVRFLAPAGAVFTASKVGDDTGDSDADSTGTTAARSISANDVRIDAGIRMPADVSVTKVASPSSGTAPLVASYTVRTSNAGSGPAAGLVLVDSLPSGAEILSGSISAGQGTTSATSTQLTWNVGRIDPGVAVTLTYQLRHPDPATATNRTQVTAATTLDPDSSPNAASMACTSQPSEDDCASATVGVTPPMGSVNGTVWRDSNGDGQRQVGEPEEAGVTVRLHAGTAQGAIVGTAVTASGGQWSLSSITVGEYVVEVVAPAGARLTSANVGPDATDSDVDSGGQATVTVSGGATTTADGGLARADTPTGDQVLVPQGIPVTFNVLDDDGIPGRPAGSVLPSGWTWSRQNGPAWGSVTCDANGTCTYLSLQGRAGFDAFRYTLENPLFGPVTVEVSIEVLHVNDPPVARDDRAVADDGAPVTVAVTANDQDPNDPAVTGDPNRPGDSPTVTSSDPVIPGGAGSASCTAASCTFLPSPGFSGPARFTYTITDQGTSDPRVENSGVPGGLASVSPRSSTATVEISVDLPPRTPNGFTDRAAGQTTTGRGSWGATTSSSAAASCTGGRPRVAISWDMVPKATGYRVERRPVPADPETDSWIEVTTVSTGIGSFSDDLVGEGQTLRYRVTPLRHRLLGQPSAESEAQIPPATSPMGC